MSNELKPVNIAQAADCIADCERDLNRVLSPGERVDLLADNSTWSLDYIRRLVAHITVSQMFPGDAS